MNKSLIATAMEALDTGSEEEMEYGFFIHLTDEQLFEFSQGIEKAAKNRQRGINCQGIVEIALPSKVPYNGVKSRLRLYTKPNGEESCELTTKKVVDEITKTEYNDPINIVNFQALAGGGKSAIARKRYTIPFLDEKGEVMYRKSGKPFAWEIDIYLDGTSEESFKNLMPNNWIKVDLEVDEPLANVMDILPVKSDKIIAANSSNAEDRTIIDGLYAKGYPITPYTGLEFWDDPERIIALTKF